MGDLASYSPDILIGGDAKMMTKEAVILTGASVNLSRGAVLGKITVGAVPTTGTAGGSNTGATTMTAVAGKRRTKPGIYTITCIAAAAAGGLFEVVNPDGERIGVAEVGTAFVSNEINFLINDPSTDAAIGDSFTVTVPAGSGKYALVDKAAINGSGVAAGILAEDADARSADVTTIMYHTGQFNKAALSFAADNTWADHEADLRAIDIHGKDVVA